MNTFLKSTWVAFLATIFVGFMPGPQIGGDRNVLFAEQRDENEDRHLPLGAIAARRVVDHGDNVGEQKERKHSFGYFQEIVGVSMVLVSHWYRKRAKQPHLPLSALSELEDREEWYYVAGHLIALSGAWTLFFSAWV